MNKLRILSLIELLKTNLIELEHELNQGTTSCLEGVTYQDILEYENYVNEEIKEEESFPYGEKEVDV